MKFHDLVVPVATSLLLASCSSSKKSFLQVQAITHIQNPAVMGITIDGNDADWQGVALNSSPGKTFEYSVAHNDEDVFVRMKIASPFEQMKFLTGGMEIWIDPEEQEKQKVEVVYPVKGELAAGAMQPATPAGNKKQDRDLMHLTIRAQMVSMNRVGFKPEFCGAQTISQNTGFKGAINWNEADELIYEVKIPLKAFTETISVNHMQMGFSMGTVEHTAETHTGGENSGSFHQGGINNGRRGGGYHGGGQGSSGNGERNTEKRNGGNRDTNTDWQKMREKESFWVECS